MSTLDKHIDDEMQQAWRFHRPDRSLEDLLAWRAELAEGALPDIISAHAREHPNKTALVVSGEQISYSEFDRAVAGVAAWLRRQGLDNGDRVLVVGHNSVSLLISCIGAMRAGGIAVVANPNLTPRELQHFVTDAGVNIVFVAGPLIDLARAAIRAAGRPIQLACLDNSSTDVPSVPAMAKAGGSPQVELRPEQLATLQYTSGTTGAPKGAAITHGQQLAHLRIIMATWQWTQDDILVHSLPLSHGHGLNGCYTALLAGATAIVLPRTEPSQICEAITQWHGTIFYSVPAIWERLLNWSEFDPGSFAGLRLYTSGSAPLSPAMAERIKSVLGEYPLERYGSTEAGPIYSNPLHGIRRPGTVGVTPPGVESLIVDESGRAVLHGSDGEIVVRSPSVFAGYWGKLGHSKEDFFQGDWLRTGDVGRIDPDTGHASITGRLKDMIITGGLNVYPREIETQAEAFPSVGSAAAVGIPSEKWGEQVVLAVVPSERSGTVDCLELDRYLRGRLAGYKIPKEYKVVDEIPRNHMGKVLRGDLSSAWETL